MKKRIISVSCVFVLLLSLTGCFSAYRDVPSDVGRQEYDVTEYRTTMKYYEDFKILQIADLHLGIETDVQKQLDILRDRIGTEKPDLIILTGDNFMYATKGLVESLIKTLNEECHKLSESNGERITKFAVTFGNHDNQGDYPRYYINNVIKSYTAKDGNEKAEGKYAAFVDFEDDNLFGLTNYYIDLVDDREKSLDTVYVKYRIHIIDSNSYHFSGVKYYYDVIHTEQLEHAINIYENATADKDYIGMAFFHIPFEEYKTVIDQYNSDEIKNKSELGQGEFREDGHLPYENNGSYEKLREANIISFFCGHDHKNYGDFIYNANSENVDDKAIFSYGVKSTNQLYHDKEMIGYKTITLEKEMTKEKFVSIENIQKNFKNETGGYSVYED